VHPFLKATIVPPTEVLSGERRRSRTMAQSD
jgi:hypothetical protein